MLIFKESKMRYMTDSCSAYEQVPSRLVTGSEDITLKLKFERINLQNHNIYNLGIIFQCIKK